MAETPIYHSNLNLSDIITPVKVKKLEQLLRESNYPADKMQYTGPEDRKDTSPNIPLHIGSKTELWNKIMKEVKLGWYAGPFEKIPFDNYMQSPVGLVPKAGNKTRLIFHLL